MRGYARTDTNHKEIVAAFRSLGATVLDTSVLGRGAPDLCVGYAGFSVLVEVKHGNGALTEDQVKFHGSWKGDIRIVRTVDDVIGMLRDWIE